MPAKLRYLESADELDSVFSASFIRPHVVLKHSSRCGISAHVLHELVRSVEFEINVIVVQTQRFLSNVLAERTGHTHHSPQVFILSDGKPVYHATHYGIDPAVINLKVAGSEKPGPEGVPV